MCAAFAVPLLSRERHRKAVAQPKKGSILGFGPAPMSSFSEACGVENCGICGGLRVCVCSNADMSTPIMAAKEDHIGWSI
jgi:hypothetical protein